MYAHQGVPTSPKLYGTGYLQIQVHVDAHSVAAADLRYMRCIYVCVCVCRCCRPQVHEVYVYVCVSVAAADLRYMRFIYMCVCLLLLPT